ncbi:unnamed protein product [Rotaria sp. Silwood1]|nr:unnamed protein product [Rotaria sp. Silwood1]CAF4831014.1 unnamed protein product [Rotaria sp. Silwood1]
MGAGKSIKEKNEASILRHPEQGEASALYWACRAGNFDTVQKLIASTPYVDINRLEPNGSTALHAASFFGHADIVRLLLHQCGVMRHRRNLHGFTAYEEADTDEIHALFHRSSGSQRFCSDIVVDAKHLFTWIGDEKIEYNDEMPQVWRQEVNNDMSQYSQLAAHIGKTITTSSVVRSLIPLIIHYKDQPDLVCAESKAATDLQHLIDEYITPSHTEYRKACVLVSKYVTTKDVEHLISRWN